MTRTFSVEAWYAAISSRDFEQLRPFLAPNIRYEDVPTGTVSEGVEAVGAFFQRVWAAIPDMVMTPGHHFETNEGACAEWVTTGTFLNDFPGLPATGGPFRSRGVSMLELSGDKVRRVSDYWDVISSGLIRLPGMGEPHA
jgi:steroid delta-isomerase-like uncharacterized protein